MSVVSAPVKKMMVADEMVVLGGWPSETPAGRSTLSQQWCGESNWRVARARLLSLVWRVCVLEEVGEVRYGLLCIFSGLKDGRKSCGTEEVVVFAGGRINVCWMGWMGCRDRCVLVARVRIGSVSALPQPQNGSWQIIRIFICIEE